MGFENHDKRAWVCSIMQQVERKDIGNYLRVVSSNISATTFLSLVSLMLSYLMGAWISTSSSYGFLQSRLIYRDTRPTTVAIKHVSLLLCFLLTFVCFVKSSRSYVFANQLISIPGCDSSTAAVITKAAEIAVVRATASWTVGLRALYFALVMLFWFFGLVTTSVAMVVVLYYLDHNSMALIDHRFTRMQAMKKVEERISQCVIRSS